MNRLLSSMIFAVPVMVLAQDAPAPIAAPDEAKEPAFRVGLVTGDRVNVRSGPSTNYYPVTRVSQGDRLMVHEIKHNWAHISPPAGCYSLVAKEFVDPDGEDKGVINGDRVWVHPGSDLTPGPYYAKQLQLNRGLSISILGAHDAYYKIVPPAGAKVWISADYVEILPVGEALVPAAAVAQAEALAENVPPAPSDEGIDDQSLKIAIAEIEADLEQEFLKDAMQRDFTSFIERYQEIAEQDGDYEAQQYANYRIDQLRRTTQRIEAMKQMRALAAQVERQHEQFIKARANVRPQAPPMEEEFAVRGKFVKSFAYDSPAGPTRWRLVSPQGNGDRTVAYVEIEPHSNIDPQRYIGRFVGVRAKGQRLIPGSTDTVVVYVAAEIVILEQAQGSAASSMPGTP